MFSDVLESHGVQFVLRNTFADIQPVLKDGSIFRTGSVPQFTQVFRDISAGFIALFPLGFDPFDVFFLNLVYGVPLLDFVDSLVTERGTNLSVFKGTVLSSSVNCVAVVDAAAALFLSISVSGFVFIVEIMLYWNLAQ